MENKNLTALEWIHSISKQREPDRFDWEQAKQMERDKHDKWNKFLEIEMELRISEMKTIERIQWYYNQYFNTSYNKYI